MNNKTNVLHYIKELDVLIAGISLVVLIFITFVGVLMRYFFNNPFVWLQEVQLWCFVWVVFFGGGAAFRNGSHVAIEFIVEYMKPTMKKITIIFGYIVFLGVSIYFLVHGTYYVNQLMRIGRITSILKVPYVLIYSALPICFVLLIIDYSIIIKKEILLLKGGE